MMNSPGPPSPKQAAHFFEYLLLSSDFRSTLKIDAVLEVFFVHEPRDVAREFKYREAVAE
jgi:hypothetical protein